MATLHGNGHDVATAATAPVSEMGDTGTLRRRGIIAGAAALAAGLLAREALDPPRVAATDGSALIVGQPNSTSAQTSLDGNYSPTGGNYPMFLVTNYTSGPAGAIQGVGNTGYGVLGTSTSGNGVGASTTTGNGVYGHSYGTGAGVRGLNTGAAGSAGFGVLGSADNSHGVYGNTNAATNSAGVYGIGNGGTTYGVFGNGFGSGTGVMGQSTSNTGVQGVSSTGIGVYGVHSDTSGSGVPYGVVGSVAGVGIGIYGVVNTAGAVAFAGGAGVNGAIAAQFSGPVNIYHTGGTTNGNLYIQGNYTAGGTKSAAVPHPDGTHRLLYCMESPEAWFEDFGEGVITAGKAEVTLDPDFAAVVDTSTLHVFPVPHDEHHALHVAGKSATGFTVGVNPSAVGLAAGKKATDLSGSFTYRVVAKRKDVKAERLAKFAVPQEIKAPALMIPPVPPTSGKPAPAAVPLPPPPMGEKKG